MIACGPEKKGYNYDIMHAGTPLVPSSFAPNNKGWSIGADNVISWKTSDKKNVHFSTPKKGGTQIYAEVCSTYGHLDQGSFVPGKPKAYFVDKVAT